MLIERRLLKNLDFALLGAVICAILFGCAMIYSATRWNVRLTSSNPCLYVKKQAAAAVVGAVASIVVLGIDYRYLARFANVLYVAGIVLLASVFVLGTPSKGAMSWIRIGPVAIQPSEYAKIAVVIGLAAYLVQQDDLSTLSSFIVPAILALVPMGLVIAENDLGSALVLAPVFFAMMYAAGADPKLLGLIIGVGLFVIVPFSYFFLLKEHQQMRILVFFNPGLDPRGFGWNVTQSVIAIGSGGFAGKGFGQSTQARLNFLPEHHTDFIFSVIAEELGFLGAIASLALLFFIVRRGYGVAQSARDRFGSLVAVGLTTIMLVHIFVNVGMTMNVSPCTGIPLPFFSAGGSSLIATMLGVALLQSIHMRRKKIVF
ncbi:MAG TPA: rod shape-determining protein RodA [Firmicutes bacterium]|jgi:rod shape determining protein RodA|nr:rod shape-determining protein RodA [Bacillota bacterium]HBK60930.1 rod shape-determining protein RodA [Bacillota bacterium]